MKRLSKLERRKKLYELEHLVLNGGDEDRIKQLRMEINIDSKHATLSHKFNPKDYERMRKQGMNNIEIASALGMSKATLYKIRLEHGLLGGDY
jgi:hypothetical protein